MTKPCKRCGNPAISGFVYCRPCKKVVLAELRETGYLETGGFGRKGQNRTPEMKEAIRETKNGPWQG